MKRILVAYDGEEPARRALETAIELAERFHGSIGVVSVVPALPPAAAAIPWDGPDAYDRDLAEAKAILAEHGMEAELMEPIGSPGPTIERIAEDGGYDTIVVGSRRLGPVSRFLQGSVSSHVATHANATVVVAR